ncbi:MAG: hypothetical protein ACEY3A_02325, partial [Wolbachia sp.]
MVEYNANTDNKNNPEATNKNCDTGSETGSKQLENLGNGLEKHSQTNGNAYGGPRRSLRIKEMNQKRLENKESELGKHGQTNGTNDNKNNPEATNK